MNTLIKGGRIVTDNKITDGDVLIEDEDIIEIVPRSASDNHSHIQNIIDATGCYVLPGIIDSHVHFREPGLTEKADIESESRAAAAGGVTSYMEMPNTAPQTTTLEAFLDKQQRAARSSHVNYSFFFGATNTNAPLFSQLDRHLTPGIKLFMGSSTGNMLVDGDEALHQVFSSAVAARLPVMAHCEDTAIINRNMAMAKAGYGDDPDVSLHPFIRSEEACLASTRKAIALARQHGARLHVAHVSTAEELEELGVRSEELGVRSEELGVRSEELGVRSEELGVRSCLPMITGEATVGHLYFSTQDYARLGTRIKVNPAIKSPVDQFMLRQALSNGCITTVATDHAPHLLSQKQGGCAKAASGMPMVQFSLVTMLELVDARVLTLERLVELMSHNPARLFEVRRRGFIRQGYKADLVIVRPNAPWTVTTDLIESKCQWSPLEGHTFSWRVERTLCNGHVVYSNGAVDRQYIGQPLLFR